MEVGEKFEVNISAENSKQEEAKQLLNKLRKKQLSDEGLNESERETLLRLQDELEVKSQGQVSPEEKNKFLELTKKQGQEVEMTPEESDEIARLYRKIEGNK